MSTYLPGTASVLALEGSIPGSEGRVVWIGIVAPHDFGASCTFWHSSGCDKGASILATMKTGPCTMSPLYGPFNLNASGLYVGNLDSGCAIVWMR